MNPAERMMKLFSGHQGAHGTHGVPEQELGKLKWEIKKTARTLREPVTLGLWEKHLSGKRPLGVVSIREDGTCDWGSIDIDEYDMDIVSTVKSIGDIPLLPCRSKSGGLHLFMFTKKPVSAADMQNTLRDLAAKLGFAGSEIFPKQTQILADRGDLGNWMIMPYFGSTYDGKLEEQVGIKKTGAEMTVSEFLRTTERMRLTGEEFRALSKINKKTKAELFADGPPCLQHLSSSGFPDGGRNNSLFMIGTYLKRRDSVNWKKMLEDANQKFMVPPLSSEEVASAVRSHEKKDYEYTCKIEPMCSHCDSAICRTRKFGVGEEGNFPNIQSLSMLDTNPPIWFIDVDGMRLEITTDELQNYVLFHKSCMQNGKCYLSMRQDAWLRQVHDAMENRTLIEVSAEVGAEGRFMEYLEDFLTNRQRGVRQEDILSGRPWENENEKRHYFRLRDLQKYLDRENVRDDRGNRIGRNKISRVISRAGGGHQFFSIKNRGVNCWWVPSETVSEVPTADAPPQKDEPI